MATYYISRRFGSRDLISDNQRPEEKVPAPLPALLPPRPPRQQEVVSPRRLAPTFTRKREVLDTQSEIMTAQMPITQLIAAANTSKSTGIADTRTLNPTPPVKPKRKRIRAKTERRREQCRNNQARYRDRQRGFVRELEESVQKLQDEIQRLTLRRHTLCYGEQTKHSPWRVVVEYFRLLRYGFLMPISGWDANCSNEPTFPDQVYFLRAVLADDVVIGELTGVDAFIEQWKRYSSYFGSLHLHLKRMEEQTLGGITATATLSLTITEASLRHVFPHLLESNVEEFEYDNAGRVYPLHSRLLGQRLECSCTMHFVWDDMTGRVTRIDFMMDLLSPLLRVLGNLEDVTYVLGKASLTPAYSIGEVQTGE
ncbi:unnamed protein product [Phytophthora fragariaefolia]|uniref:Unnamed protein product n=1 Tax=Phytophthora fragariaefolia TaxID=1490495 RepID=A0A9W6XV50_9STRA|nr:unnamed protein product [Phytophthora fragariaefolia]